MARPPERTPAAAHIAPGRVRSAIRWLVYPGLLGGAMVLLWGLLDVGASLAWAPYIAIAIAGPMVILAERALPYRPEWQASWPDLAEDGLYLTLVQIALPLVLAWTAVWVLNDKLGHSVVLVDVWPRHWPIWAQLLTKIVVGDFFR